jgi:hypothetical protein
VKNDAKIENLETKPGIANAEEGYVFLDGPDGIAITLTAEAAIATGENLIAAAKIALSQMGAGPDAELHRIH